MPWLKCDACKVAQAVIRHDGQVLCPNCYRVQLVEARREPPKRHRTRRRSGRRAGPEV